MSLLTSSIANQFKESIALANTVFSTEKTKVPAVKAQARQQFLDAHDEFQRLRSQTNSSRLQVVTHPEVFTLAAEAAFTTENYETCRSLVEEYLQFSPQEDQFFCRQKIILGLLIDIESDKAYGGESILRRKKSLEELIIALDVATRTENKQRYEFIVFNVSVDGWKIMRPYLRSGRAKYFVEEMYKFVTNLESLTKVDKDWLITYYGGASFCLADAGNGKNAAEMLDKAVKLAEEAVSTISQREESNQEDIIHMNTEIEECQKKIHAEESMLESLLTERQKRSVNGDEDVDDDTDESTLRENIEKMNHRMISCQTAVGELKDKAKNITEIKAPLVNRMVCLYMQRIHCFPEDGKKYASSPDIVKSYRLQCLAQLHCVQAGCISENESVAALKELLDRSQKEQPSSQVAESFFDICRTARFIGGSRGGGQLKEIAKQSYELGRDVVRSSNLLTAVILVKQDLCSATLMVDNCYALKKKADVSDENYCENDEVVLVTEKQAEGFAINNRLEAIKLLERVLQISQSRLNDSSLVQEICVEIWNAVFPMLVCHLRGRIHRTLHAIATALSEIESPLLRLRSQIHFELARCEEQSDFVVKAHAEAKKAYDLDYGNLKNAPLALQGDSTAQASGKGKGKGSAVEEPQNIDEPFFSREENLGYDSDRPLDVVVAPFVDSLFLRSSVFSSPEGVEDQVLTNIQQIRESSSKRYKKETLSKSARMIFNLLRNESESSLLGNFGSVVEWEERSGSAVPGLLDTSSTTTSLASGINGSNILPIGVIDKVVEKAGKAPEPEETYAVLLKSVQKRIGVMMDIARIGHVSQAEIYQNALSKTGYISRSDDKYRESLCYIVEKCLLYILSFSWDPRDVMVEKLVVEQIEAACLMSESLINRMDSIKVDDEDFIEITSKEGYDSSPDSLDSKKNDSKKVDFVDPRAIGIIGELSDQKSNPKPLANSSDEVDEDSGVAEGKSELELRDNEATVAMMNIKRMVLKLQRKALDIAVQAGDVVAVQNVVTYFWNTHIHIFRKRLYHLMMPETLDFLQDAVSALNTVSDRAEKANAEDENKKGFPVIDYRLSSLITEALSLAHESKGDVEAAVATARSGCSGEGIAGRKPYFRRKLCELVSRLNYVSGGGGGSGKGTKKGGSEIVFDHPLLNVYGLLQLIELFEHSSGDEKKTIPNLVDQATQLMHNEVETAIVSLNENLGENPISAEENAQYQEMLVECWARLTRANLKMGDVHATDATASKCMEVLSNGIIRASKSKDTGDPEAIKGVHKRVWRWASLCERCIGIAISQLIKSEGQDKSIQNQLQLASLRHLSLSCQFGVNAVVDSLVLSSALDAWNISLRLLDDIFSPGSRLHETPVLKSLLTLQRQIVTSLLSCKTEEPEDQDEEDSVVEEIEENQVNLVKQQFYLAIIQEYSLREDWKIAQKTLMEAFDNVPVKLQKPLWKWRVIVMSKLGKSVLDGIQKLKENDSSLQARVYAILARSAKKSSQQLEAYRKTIDILKNDIQRVEYLLETAQWMSSAGMPLSIVAETIQGAVDALYEIEEQYVEEKSEQRGDNASEVSKTSRQSSKSSSKSSRRGSARMIGSRGRSSSRRSSLKKSSSSVKSAKTDPGAVNVVRLNLKQLDQAIRCSVMLAMIEGSMERKGERCLEAMFFLDRCLSLWQETMEAEAQGIVQQFSEELKASPESFDKSGKTPTASGLTIDKVTLTLLGSRIPSDPVDLISWIPPSEFSQLMQSAVSTPAALNVPSLSSLQNLQLSLFYFCKMSEILDYNGYVKSSLKCLGWIRLCVMHCPDFESPEPVLAAIYFKSLQLLAKTNSLTIEESDGGNLVRLESKLGRSEASSADLVSKFSSTSSETASTGIKKAVPSGFTVSSDSFDKIEMESFDTSRAGTARTDTTRPSTGAARASTVPTWTLEIPAHPDKMAWFMDIATSLFSMGLIGWCKRIASHVQLESRNVSSKRMGLESSTLLAEIDLLAGKASDVVAQVGALSGLMSEVGDCSLVARHAMLLLRSYVMLSSNAEAADVAQQALQTLESAVSVALPAFGSPDTHRQSNLLPTASNSTLHGTSASKASFATECRSTSASKSAKASIDTQTIEYNFEACSCFVDVAFEYIDLVLVPAHLDRIRVAMMTGKMEFNDNFFEAESIINLLLRCEALAIQVEGQESFLWASVASRKSSCLFELYFQIHCNFSRIYSNGRIASYSTWFRGKISELISTKQSAIDVYIGLQGRVPFSETNYCNPDNPAERVHLSSVISRAIASSQLQFCEMLVKFGWYETEYVAPSQNKDASALNVIEKYLESSKPVAQTNRPVSVSTFEVSPLKQALTVSADACNRLLNSEQVREANLYMASASVASDLESRGGAEKSWQRLQEDVKDASLAFDLSKLKTLESCLLSAIVSKHSLFYDRSLAFGALYAADACGQRCPATTALYLMLLQGVTSREWLFRLWRQSLNPSSELSSSLRRIEKLLGQKVAPNSRILKRLEAEYAFLDSSSVAWQRLKITETPQNIVSHAMIPSSTCIILLQLCPLGRTLYVTTGFPKVSPDAVDDQGGSLERLPGEWCVDKLHLNESDRNRLQTMVHQHESWVEATQKFVASYSEGITGGMDFEGYEGSQKNHLLTDLEKTILKSEHALEEELRSLIEGLEELLHAVIGSNSPVYDFLANHASDVGEKPSAMLLLGDENLQLLPWESLSLFDLFRGHVVRDYSVHFLGNRFSPCKTDGSSVTVNAMKVRCIVDPFGDDDVKESLLGDVTDKSDRLDGYGAELITHANEVNRPRKNMKSVVEVLRNERAGGSKWEFAVPLGAKGSGMSLQDWITLARHDAAPYSKLLFAYLPGRLVGSLISTKELVNLDLQSFAASQVVDRTQTDSSYRRQQSHDSRKAAEDIELERPHRVAAVMSLAGVGCVVCRQWYTPPTALDKSAKTFWNEFSNERKTMMETLASYRSLKCNMEQATDDESSSSVVPCSLRRWIRHAQVGYGIGNIEYAP